MTSPSLSRPRFVLRLVATALIVGGLGPHAVGIKLSLLACVRGGKKGGI